MNCSHRSIKLCFCQALGYNFPAKQSDRSDLRSLLAEHPSHPQPSDENQNNNEKLVIVRGQVEAKSGVDGNWKSLRPNHNNVLVSHQSGDKAVIVQTTQTVSENS